MKNLKLLLMFVAAGSFALMTSCSGKDGAPGPAGTDGVAGTNGASGSVISAADQGAYDAADGLDGGQYYDNVGSAAGITDTAVLNHADFFRCKQCHGWDLRGSKGAYINRAPTATRPEVAPNDLYVYAQTHNIKEIFDAVKHTGGRYRTSNGATSYSANMPDFGKLLTDAQIWKIVKFLKAEAHNAFDFYDMATTGSYPTGTKTYTNVGKDGNAANGLVVYNSTCKSCHGADGRTILIYCGDEYLGDVFRNGPHELQHKAKFGMPYDNGHPSCQYAGSMAAWNLTNQEIKDLLVLGQDPVMFPGF